MRLNLPWFPLMQEQLVVRLIDVHLILPNRLLMRHPLGLRITIEHSYELFCDSYGHAAFAW